MRAEAVALLALATLLPGCVLPFAEEPLDPALRPASPPRLVAEDMRLGDRLDEVRAWAAAPRVAVAALNFTFPAADDVPLAATLFLPPGAPYAVVLRNHGWAGDRREGELSGEVALLLRAGFGVLTWDARGFGQSGDVSRLNHPGFEVADVSSLVDFIATLPGAYLDADGDPRVGMIGASYGGAIQLLAASFDPRIDAIVPHITWSDLLDSLVPQGVPKTRFIATLYAAGVGTSALVGLDPREGGVETGAVDPVLTEMFVEGTLAGGAGPRMREELLLRSPMRYLANATAATLLLQGLPDTLFTGTEAVRNARILRDSSVPFALLLHDGGHGPYDPLLPSDRARVEDVMVRWLEHFLLARGERPLPQGGVLHYASDRVWREGTFADLDAPPGETLPLGPVTLSLPAGPPVDVLLRQATESQVVLGVPVANLTATGAIAPVDVFVAPWVLRASGPEEWLHHQSTGARLEPGVPLRFELPLLDAVLAPGDRLVLRFTGADANYGAGRNAAVVELDGVVEVPAPAGA